MEKSIENIWKDGFLKSDSLVAPKVNDLYHQKSKHVVEQLRRMFRNNLIIIMIASVVFLMCFIYTGVPLAGFLVFALLSWLVYYSRKFAQSLEKIDSGMSSYRYLKAFDSGLKDIISKFIRINRFFYPVIITVVCLGILYSTPKPFLEQAIIDIIIERKDPYTMYGLPVFYLLGVIVYAGLFGVFAGHVYRYDVKLIYGRVLKKLREILADMEELRKEEGGK